MSDIFDDISKKEQQLLEQFAQRPIVEISGIVNVNGVRAGRIGGEQLWTMTIKLDAWRVGEGALKTESLIIKRKVSDENLKKFQKLIKAESIIKINVRLIEENISGTAQALFEELIQVDLSDQQLHDYLVELKKPIYHKDKILGTFSFDRSVNWYIATVIWNDEAIKLNLSIDNATELDATLQVAHSLWRDQVTWKQRIVDYAVHELLSLKNESWLDEDELEVTNEQFKNRMKLDSITVYSDGSFEFWHDDGDLFWGHSILISGSLTDGPTFSDIPG